MSESTVDEILVDVAAATWQRLRNGAGLAPIAAYRMALREMLQMMVGRGVASHRAAAELQEALREYCRVAEPPPPALEKEGAAPYTSHRMDLPDGGWVSVDRCHDGSVGIHIGGLLGTKSHMRVSRAEAWAIANLIWEVCRYG